MRKEVLIAIVLGSVMGLVIAYGIWRANISLRANQITANEDVAGESSPSIIIATSTPVPQVSNEFKITLAKPLNESILTESTFNLSGITKADSYIVIVADDNDYIIKSDPSGVFETTLDAKSGLNDITLFAFNGNEKSTTNVQVVYSSEFNKKVQLIDASSSARVDEIAQKKLEEAQKNPKAFLGTVTDITEKTLQIKSKDAQILQAALGTDTSYVRTVGTSKEVTQGDLAIGDFVIALGYKNSKGVLDTTRIIITATPQSSTKEVYFGTVSTVTTKNIIMKDTPSGADQTVTIAKKYLITKEGDTKTITKLTSIKESEKIITVGNKNDKGFEARRIHILPSL